MNIENKKSNIISTSEITTSAAIEPADVLSSINSKNETDRSPTRLSKIGHAALEVAAFAGMSAATYAAIRSGSLDSIHAPIIEGGDATMQLMFAVQVGAVGLSTARFAGKRLSKTRSSQ